MTEMQRLTLWHIRVRVDRSTWESDARPASANEVLPPTDLTRNLLFVANSTRLRRTSFHHFAFCIILHHFVFCIILQATLCGSSCLTANRRGTNQCNSFLFNELDKVCRLGKAALYEDDFKEGGMEVFVKLNPDGSVPIAADGWYSSWTSWQTCSKTCAGGTRKRSKTYTPPVNGGLEVLPFGGSSILDEEACNTQNCPVDGTWKEWSSWCCSTCCGAGVSSRLTHNNI